MIQTELCEHCNQNSPMFGIGICESCWKKFIDNQSKESVNGDDTEKSDREESSGSIK